MLLFGFFVSHIHCHCTECSMRMNPSIGFVHRAANQHMRTTNCIRQLSYTHIHTVCTTVKPSEMRQNKRMFNLKMVQIV